MKRPRAIAMLAAGLTLLLGAVGTGLAAPTEPGQRVEAFSLSDERGAGHRLQDLKGKVVVVVAWASDDPGSKNYAERLRRLARDYGRRVTILGLAPNTGETRESVSAAKAEQELPFPILLDPGSRVARSLGAGVTPTAFVIDAEGVLRYAGAIDDDPGGRRDDRRQFLRDALDAVLGGRAPSPAKTPARGARIR